MAKNYHEIIICGAGMIGLTFALLMAKKKINVCIIDKNDKNLLFAQRDNRTTAISQGSYRIYKKLGIWEKLNKKFQPINQIFVSEGLGAHDINFDCKNLKEGPLGFIVDNKLIKRTLLDEVSKSKYISYKYNTEISKINNEDLNKSFIETNNLNLYFKMLVAADGRFSRTRYHANIKYYFHDYQQTAFVFNISHSDKHQGIALERFFPTGPLAILPVNNSKINQSSVVWTVDSELANDNTFRKNFRNEFEKKYDNFFGKLTSLSEIKRYPLNVFSCYDTFKKNIILIGDACQAIHPIAGQGFNLGLRDAFILAETLEKSRELGLEPFNFNLMKSYENMRKIDKSLLVNATHNLNSLFSGSGKFKSLFRKTGLKIFSQSNFLKNQSMLFAMGLKSLEA
jgi:2-octaprenyl-6-methoxyphenol hydroxylase